MDNFKIYIEISIFEITNICMYSQLLKSHQLINYEEIFSQ